MKTTSFFNEFAMQTSRLTFLPAFVLLSSLITGCASSQSPNKGPLVLTAVGTSFLEEEGQISAPPIESGITFIEATGKGFPAPCVTNKTQKRLTAIDAARYGALANMAEKIKGLQITRDARVQDMVFAGENISATLCMLIQGASTVCEEYDEDTEVATVQLRITRDAQGNTILRPVTHMAPASIYTRTARAEAAARINATAALREQVGQIYVMQTIGTKDLKFESQQAQSFVKGQLEGANFSAPRWINDEQCEVTAVLEINSRKEACNPQTQSE